MKGAFDKANLVVVIVNDEVGVDASSLAVLPQDAAQIA